MRKNQTKNTLKSVFFFLTFQFGMVLFFVGLLVNPASAHQSGNSYLMVTETKGRLQVEIDFIVRDLSYLLQESGQAKDSPATPEQIQLMQSAITHTIQQSLNITVNEQAMALDFSAQSVVLHNDGLYVRQRFTTQDLPETVGFVVLRYGFFTQNDKLGRAFFKMLIKGEEISSVFDQDHAIQRFAMGDSKRWSTIGLFTQEGAKHIWEGTDHLLFLLSLLLPGLLLTNRPAGLAGSQPVSSREAEKFALKVITAFTVAHSITLALSIFGWVSLPDKFIESMIALSIIFSALLNLQNRFHFKHWKLAFVFGLIHGMGFANGLKELGLTSMYFLETLFAFNLGVELGQLIAVIVVAVPMLLLFQREQAKQKLVRYGSLAVLLMASVWLIERIMA